MSNMSQKEYSYCKAVATISFWEITIIYPIIRVESVIDINNVFFKRELANMAPDIVTSIT